ncbi:type I secretion system permease/ATPase [Endozoicomonas arenosclerae]|uniref:type I secretion system permease/ATPase n=1 Tax=Endozoicomonas arenosclerae TaxID=1633495 RepID=UPI00155FAE41|nr:type I secretion system permease/ATPase [Endozoicomonas arenosclerae]
MSLFHSDHDPLINCLEELTRYFHCDVSVETLLSGLPVSEQGLLPSQCQRALAKAGLESSLSEQPLKTISSSDLPVILLLLNDKATVVYQCNAKTGKAIIGESVNDRKEIDIQDIEGIYSGYLIQVKPEKKYSEATSEKSSSNHYPWFRDAILPYWGTFRDVLIASFMVNLFALVSPLFVMNVYDRVVPNQAYETLWVLVAGVFIAFSFDFGIKLIRARAIDQVGKQIDIRLSAKLLEKILGLKLAVRPGATGSFMNNLAEFDSIRQFLTSATILTLIDLPFVLLFLSLITWIAPSLVAIPLVCMALAAGVAVLINSPLQKAIEKSQQASCHRQSFLLETLLGLESIKASSAENHHQFHWERSNQQIAEVNLTVRKLQLYSSQAATFILQAGTILIISMGVYLIGLGELSMGGLIAVMMIAGRCTAPVIQSIGLLNQYQRTRQAMDYTDTLMGLPQERTNDRHFLVPETFRGDIRFKHIHFSYPDAPPLLKDITLEIKAGETVAILGRMGSGKSTLLQLIVGLWEPSDGHISIGELDIRQIDPGFLRSKIGYVPQKITLFSGSIRDNLLMGRQGISDERLVSSVKQAGLGDILSAHPQGLDFQVGEAGRHLSGGQIQSIGIARALLGDPNILILDEPASSMDNHAEAQLIQTLSRFNDKTILIVTHKKSLVGCADKVVVMDQGQIVGIKSSAEMGQPKVSVATARDMEVA